MKPLKLRSILILIAGALLLSAAEPSPYPSPRPIPGEGTQTTSQRSDHTGQQPQADKSPAAPTGTVANSATAPEEQPKLQQISDQDRREPQPIRVAPVNVNRDWIDYINPGLTFLLVVVGGIYAILTRCQLRTINRQATIANKALIETRKAANAAEKGADVTERALGLAERPHLIIHSFRIEGFKERIAEEVDSIRSLPEIERIVAPRIVRVTYILKNYGKSPAFIDRSVIRFRMVPVLPTPLEYGKFPNPVRGWIVPPIEERVGCRYLEEGPLTEENRMRVVRGVAHLIVYGFADYLDILEKSHRFAFGCRYIVGGGSDPGDRFEPIAQDEYWRYA
jgi:hypothetical protein